MATKPKQPPVEEAPVTFEWVCPITPQSCGDKAAGIPFRTSGWLSQDVAAARGAEHLREHETGEPMTELAQFEREHGHGHLREVPVEGEAG